MTIRRLMYHHLLAKREAAYDRTHKEFERRRKERGVRGWVGEMDWSYYAGAFDDLLGWDE